MRPSSTVRYLKYEFTEVELLEISRGLAQQMAIRSQTEDDKVRVTKDFASRLAGLDATINAEALKVQSGHEFRSIRCNILYHHPRPGRKSIVRQDTGAVVEVLIMSDDEMQEEMTFDAPPPGSSPLEPPEQAPAQDLSSTPVEPPAPPTKRGRGRPKKVAGVLPTSDPVPDTTADGYVWDGLTCRHPTWFAFSIDGSEEGRFRVAIATGPSGVGMWVSSITIGDYRSLEVSIQDALGEQEFSIDNEYPTAGSAIHAALKVAAQELTNLLLEDEADALTAGVWSCAQQCSSVLPAPGERFEVRIHPDGTAMTNIITPH